SSLIGEAPEECWVPELLMVRFQSNCTHRCAWMNCSSACALTEMFASSLAVSSMPKVETAWVMGAPNVYCQELPCRSSTELVEPLAVTSIVTIVWSEWEKFAKNVGYSCLASVVSFSGSKPSPIWPAKYCARAAERKSCFSASRDPA